MTTAAPLIFSSIQKVMTDVGAIGKDKKNEQQGYRFRAIEDIYNALHPILAKHGVFCCPEVVEHTSEDRMSKSGSMQYRVLAKVRHRFYALDGSYVDVVTVGEALDSSDKATNKAMSFAMKYAFVELLSLPFAEVEDGDRESPEAGSRRSNGHPVSKEPVTIGQPRPAPPQREQVFADPPPGIAEARKAEPVQPVAYISAGEVANFAAAFRKALPEWAQKDEETYRHQWLTENKIESTKMLRKATFLEARAAAVAWAKALPPPFTGADDSDVPF